MHCTIALVNVKIITLLYVVLYFVLYTSITGLKCVRYKKLNKVYLYCGNIFVGAVTAKIQLNDLSGGTFGVNQIQGFEF